MAHQALVAVSGALIGLRGDEAGDLGFDGLGEQRSRAIAQNFRQSIGKGPWLNQLENVSVGDGVLLLQSEVEASNTPTIRRLIPSCRHQLSRIAPRDRD
jgi:hypothetical protein